MNISPNFGNILANSVAIDVARTLIPSYRYDLLQSNVQLALETGMGDCKAVALILAALRPDIAFVRHVTRPTKGVRKAASAYIHYLVLDREVGTVIHSTGAPLSVPGAHIKAVPVADFAQNWSIDGEKRAKPASAVSALREIAEGSEHEVRKFSGYELSMMVEDPQDRLVGSTMEDLRIEALERLIDVV